MGVTPSEPTPSRDLAPNGHLDAAIASNTFFLLIAQATALVVGMLVLVSVTRLMGPAEIGRWRMGQAVAAYIMVLGDGGLGVLSTREVARGRGWLANAGAMVLLLRTVLTTLLLLALVMALAIGGVDGGMVVIVAVVGLTAVANSMSAQPLLQGLEQIAPTSKLRVLTQLIAGPVSIALALTTKSLVLVVIPLSVAPLVGAVTTIVWARREGLSTSAIRNVATGWFLLRSAAPFLAAGIAVQLLMNADALILGVTRGSEELGLYAGPYALASYLMILGVALTQAAFPRMASRVDGESREALLSSVLGLSGLFGLPLAVGGAVLSGPIVVFLFGSLFEHEGSVLVLLLSFAAIGFFNMSIGQWLAAIGREHEAMVVAVASAALNVGLNLLLIPWFGRTGAACVVVASECSSALLYCFYARDSGWYRLIVGYASCLPQVLAMGAVVWIANAAGLHVIVSIALGVVVYVAVNLAWPSPGARSLLHMLRPPADLSRGLPSDAET